MDALQKLLDCVWFASLHEPKPYKRWIRLT
jgi:hypothetical protein